MFALEFAILQGGIAARTPTQMQGSEVKEKKEITTYLPHCITFHCNHSELNPYAKIRKRMPLPLHYREVA